MIVWWPQKAARRSQKEGRETMFDNFLQGFGLIACIGAILLVVLVVGLARSVFGSRSKATGVDREDERIRRERGSARPQYDDRRIETTGGFGDAPASSSSRRERDPDDRSSGFGRVYDAGERRSDSDRGQDLDDTVDRLRRSRREDDDRDNDVRSRGGFGG